MSSQLHRALNGAALRLYGIPGGRAIVTLGTTAMVPKDILLLSKLMGQELRLIQKLEKPLELPEPQMVMW